MSEIDPDILRGYVRYLERGATTHASYGQAASEQAVATSKYADNLQTSLIERAEEGEPVSLVPLELAQLRIVTLELQASIHTVGLSVCLLGLSLLAGQGHSVPQAPRLPEEPPA